MGSGWEGYEPWRTALEDKRPAIELQKAWRESCGGLVVSELTVF